MAELIATDAAAHAERNTTPFAGQLADVAAWTQTNTAAPQMMSGIAEARLLEALIAVSGARRILEVGTFTGLGTLTMAAALGPEGAITTLEVDEENAATARRHFEASEHHDRIELIVGDALATLSELSGPFDLVYIDADKTGYPRYYEAVVPLLSERGVIVADNLFRAGAVLDPDRDDASTAGMREFTARVQEDERVHNVLLTIGDGVMLAWPVPGSRHG